MMALLECARVLIAKRVLAGQNGWPSASSKDIYFADTGYKYKFFFFFFKDERRRRDVKQEINEVKNTKTQREGRVLPSVDGGGWGKIKEIMRLGFFLM